MTDTSRKELKASVEALSDGENNNFVLDFLYYDSRRVGSFLSQFDASGHLTGITQSESITKGRRATGGASISGDALLAKGEGAVEYETDNQGSEAAERVYDPLWVNATVFLNYLHDNAGILKSLADAQMGHLFLCEGSLRVRDYSMMKALWNLPAIKKMISDSTKQPGKSASNSDGEIARQILTVLPHAIQMEVYSEGRKVWGTLREEFLIGTATDLLLTHGTEISGDWFLLGLLDARAQYSSASAAAQMTDKAAASAGASLNNFFDALAPIVRNALGRPLTAHGATPLMLFRKVAKAV